jgi:6-phosphogluconolactonase
MQLQTLNKFDEHTLVWIGDDLEDTLEFALIHWFSCADLAQIDHQFFTVALSGGSTPAKIYHKLPTHPDNKKVDWENVLIYFSDERNVGPEDKDNNYKMAMESGISKLPIPKQHIFRMHAEQGIEQNAVAYEALIKEHVQDSKFDLIMLGCGDDGHTASLFPNTQALNETEKMVVANEVPQKKTVRMTMTYPLINKAQNIAIYAFGETKRSIIKEIFIEKQGLTTYPIQRVGTKESPVLWIMDKAAGKDLLD